MTRPAPERLELGCGIHKVEGFFGIDKAVLPGVDLVHDLNQRPWPLESNCALQVLCHQCLEHIPDTIGFMKEVWRVCKPNAWVEIVVPYYRSSGAWGDPTHVRAFSETSFDYFEPDFVDGFSDYNISPAHFHIVELAWNPRGNLWVIMRSIKDEAALEAHREEKIWRSRKAEILR